MIRLYGIKNCDTVKKAANHLKNQGTEYEFVDFKKTPPTKVELQRWKKFLGDWPVNPRGRTYKAMKNEFESATESEKQQMLIENTSLIKRPILENAERPICFGYDKEIFEGV